MSTPALLKAMRTALATANELARDSPDRLAAYLDGVIDRHAEDELGVLWAQVRSITVRLEQHGRKCGFKEGQDSGIIMAGNITVAGRDMHHVAVDHSSVAEVTVQAGV